MSQLEEKKFSIKIRKSTVAMDHVRAEKTWKFLEEAILEIYNHHGSGLSFEELYRNAYNMVLHGQGETLYSGLVTTVKEHLRQTPKVIIESTQGRLFLDEVNKQWVEHTKALQMIHDILMYMDRTFVISFNKAPVHELGLSLWKVNIVRSPKIRIRLRNTILNLIPRERADREVIDRGLMRNIIKMLTDLGATVYEEEFERPFLSCVKECYKLESQQLIETSDCLDYLKKAERRISEELERASHYLGPESEPKIRKIIAVVEREMIGNHMELLVGMENSGLVSMLVADRYDDLARMYNLFGLVDGGPQIILDVMIKHVRETGGQLVMDTERWKDPVDFVQRLLDEKDKLDKLMHTSFNNDKTFQNALNSSFEYFVNLNNRSPEFISLFMDYTLRQGLKGVSEEDVETAVDKVMMLFRHLREKDMFEKYYKQHLAKRLLSGRAVSVMDSERSLMVKLKTECGYQFTSKLEGMFTDMKTSTDTMRGFNATLSPAESSQGPNLAVQVLTTGAWPTQSGAVCNLPTEALSMCAKFKAYYLSAHTGRRLTWQTNMGTADLKATFGNGQKHEINVSTYQMCILALFNMADKVSYREIEQATAIPAQDLKRNLQSLACVKGKNVLRKEPMSKNISEDDVFFFNDKFASKSYKLKISTVVSHKESEPEKQETRQKVEEDRKPQIEAAIVRVMKSRRELNHNNLVAEVTKLLQGRFLPNPAVIKRRIEALIERDFLERDSLDRTLYRYLA